LPNAMGGKKKATRSPFKKNMARRLAIPQKNWKKRDKIGAVQPGQKWTSWAACRT